MKVGRLIEQKYPRNSSRETIGQHNRWLEEQTKLGKENKE